MLGVHTCGHSAVIAKYDNMSGTYSHGHSLIDKLARYRATYITDGNGGTSFDMGTLSSKVVYAIAAKWL